MARVALAGVLGLLAVAGSSAAATMPAFWLHDGQTRYLLPSQARAGEVIRCTVNGKSLDTTMPDLQPRGVVGGTNVWGGGGPSLSIDRRPNGATELRCGSATSGTGSFGRLTDPYVIGQNGLALIQGRNTLATLKRTFGKPSSVSHCGASWQAIGLVATFAGADCTDSSVLTGATVRGARWGTLRGVRVGDSVARLLWQAQDAKRVGPGQWLLAAGGSSLHAQLVAVTHAGRVEGFVLRGA
jgi:hypothetical protein